MVEAWDTTEIIDLYRAGGWWKDDADPARVRELICGSFLFAVAIDLPTGRAIGMGRVLSDGISDGYIQDLVVLPGHRKRGIGRMIVSALLAACQVKGLGWIGLVAEPGSEQFYLPLGFRPMKGYTPLLFDTGGKDSDALAR